MSKARASRKALEDGLSSEEESVKDVEYEDSSSESESEESDTEMDVVNLPPPVLSPYELARLERIRRNTAKLQSLGLIGRNSLLDPSTPTPRVSQRKRNSRKAPSSVSPSFTRKSPRLLSRLASTTINLTEQISANPSTSLQPHRPNLESGSSTNKNESTRTGNSADGTVIRQRPYARTAVQVGAARRNILVSIEGKKVLHPMSASTITVKKGSLEESSKDSFVTLSDAFVRYYGDLGACYSYSRKNFQTKCLCVNSLMEGDNSSEKINQVTNSMYNFFIRTKYTQKLVFREWIRAASVMKTTNKQTCYKVSTNFNFSGVYEDAPAYTKPFQVCQNTLMRLFDYGYYKFKKLQDQVEKVELSCHGLTNKLSNNMVANQEKYKEIETSLKKFFEDLVEESETHATRVVREVSGVTLRDDEVGTVELPSSWTKRQLYSRYCFQRGWNVRADARGCLPKLQNYPVRPFNDSDWPTGSEPIPVPSRIYFDKYWKKNFPLMKIRSPSADT